MWPATTFTPIPQFVLFTEIVSSFLLGFTLPLSFPTVYTNCCGLLPPHAERKFSICKRCLWFCHTQPFLTYKAHVKLFFFYISTCKIKIPHILKPQTKKWQYSIQTALSNKDWNVKAKATLRTSSKRTSAKKKTDYKLREAMQNIP